MFCTVGDDDLFVSPQIVRVTMVPWADVGIGPYGEVRESHRQIGIYKNWEQRPALGSCSQTF